MNRGGAEMGSNRDWTLSRIPGAPEVFGKTV
jgi:hypothetical protein